ncbi:methyl-accepting chemotaxis protein [Natranaerovirga hydrolytica]|uniref:Methyl-accepting chemotaxis protein n=1 Tax=Natranaerovirga hydrolytica TaxID=680378 RepID=A0A4R1NA73_9FIRM|nr:methyl-accepting chemotaxis protein [Natranaerovirga hydrolytica]TCL00065.1 methyl-accepting chemotaxis protein [Natranaerovirga hydrolytica]
MKSIKGKLTLITTLILIFSILSISIFSLMQFTSVARSVSRSIIEDNLQSNIAVMNRYIEYEFGSLNLENNTFVNDQGEAIRDPQDFIETFIEDINAIGTLFIKEDNDFKRIATNLRDTNNALVLDTYLGQDHPGYERITNGENYLGEATLFERNYYTIYTPIINNGEAIGIMFIGIPIDEIFHFIGQNVERNQNTIVGIGSIVLTMSILLMYQYSRKLSNKIKYLTNHSKEIARGKLNKTIEERYLKGRDELSQLAHSYQETQKNLSNLINKIQESSSNVSDYTANVNDITEQISASTDEVAQTMERIASTTQEQSIDTQKASESVIELGYSIEKSGIAMKKLTRVSQSIDTRTQTGTQIINDLSNKTNANEKAINTIFETIEQTNESSKKIGEVTKVISSIADQTNLLALNATIEAARAGEHGKGFAVVASEIRQLAEESTKSTEAIQEMINNLQSNVNTSVESIDQVKDILMSQVDSVKDTQKIYVKINSAISAAIKIIKTLDESGLQMEDNKNKITEVIGNLSATAQENAAGTQETSASVEELSATMAEINKTSEQLTEMVVELNDMAKTFEV